MAPIPPAWQVEDVFQVKQASEGVFRFKLSGFLDEERIPSVAPRIEDLYCHCVDGFRGQPFVVVADLRDLRVLTEEGEQMVRRLMRYGRTRGLYWSINISPSALTRMGLKNAAVFTDTEKLRSYVPDEPAAHTLLKQKLAEIAAL